jgi:serine/threonine-protein kinase
LIDMDDLQSRLQRALGDRYRIERELGRGGTGIVLLATDTKHDRQVALKVLSPEIGQSVGSERFLREIRISAQLTHPNILTLIDSGEAEGLLFYVMPYVAGESVRARLDREKQLPVGDAVRITREVAGALDHAHAAGVIHRDVKPENILLESGHALVCDFGIATAIDQAGEERLTKTGFAIGTPAYMSPEQATGGVLDTRSDTYSLACVLYEMLVGSVPHAGATPQAVLARKAAEPAPSAQVVRDTVPGHVEEALRRALARVPADRFGTAAEFGEALGDPSYTASPTASTPVARWGVWQALAAVAVVVAAGAWLAFGGRGRVPSTPLRATFGQVTAQPGVEDSPSLSPDGVWVVYAGDDGGDRDIFLRGVGGQLPINLTADSPDDDHSPVFSPDGERIAFRSSRQGGGLFVMGRTGEAVRRVSATGFNPVWSPDGSRLAYATEHVGLLPLNWEGRSELWSVVVADGQTRLIDGGDAVQPSWSPNGRWIAYTARMSDRTEMDIWLLPADGGEPTAVTSDVPTDWSPTWSPDGGYIYFSSDRGGSMNLWRIPMDVDAGRPVGDPEPVTTPASFVAHPSVSADGRRVAYSSVLMTQNVEKATLDLDGGELVDPLPLTTGSRQWSSPDPSPDGSWVAFYSRDLPEGDLYVVRGDGSGLRQLTGDSALDRMPRWSPEGERILFFSNRSGLLQLWSIRSDGSALEQVTDGQGAGIAAWSPDTRIAANGLGSRTDRVVEIFDSRTPYSEQTPLLLPPPDSTIAAFLVNDWSRDGQRLAGMVGLSDGGVLVHDLATGTYERITDFGQWPVWLADDRSLLFVTGGRAFHVVDTRSGNVRRVHYAPRDVIGPPRVTRDGRTLVYSRRVTEGDVWLVSLEQP